MWLAALAAGAALAAPVHAGDCRVVHGRLTVWNGGTPFKIWVVGTHHLLGVENADEDAENLPPNVLSALESRGGDRFAVSVYADFTVCAVANYRPGRMQPVRLIDAKNIRVEGR